MSKQEREKHSEEHTQAAQTTSMHYLCFLVVLLTIVISQETVWSKNTRGRRPRFCDMLQLWENRLLAICRVWHGCVCHLSTSLLGNWLTNTLSKKDSAARSQTVFTTDWWEKTGRSKNAGSRFRSAHTVCGPHMCFPIPGGWKLVSSSGIFSSTGHGSVEEKSHLTKTGCFTNGQKVCFRHEFRECGIGPFNQWAPGGR